MSEFSESWHLVADGAPEGEALLRRAGRPGWVFAPAGGWVTIVPDAGFGELDPAGFAAANTGLLVHYVNAEDHGWAFTVFDGAAPVCAYEAEWTFDLAADTSRLDVEALVTRLTAAGIDCDAAAVAPLVSDELDEDALFADPFTNPGHRFAALLGWAEFSWLDAGGLRNDPQGATRVD